MASPRHAIRATAAQLLGSLARRMPRADRLRRVADDLRFVRSTYGFDLLNTPGDRTFELAVRGYGRFIAEAIEAQTEPFVFLDFGANLGLFSLIAARHPACLHVLAIEPVPQTFLALTANIRRNRATLVAAVRGAVTNVVDGEVRLSFSPRHSGLSRITSGTEGSVRAPVVGATELDALLAATTARVVAKIDVEGEEPAVLATLAKTAFCHRIDEIIVEISETNLGSAARREALLAMLAAAGFREDSRRGSALQYDARYRRRD